MAGASSGARQLPLVLPHRAAMSRSDFLVGAANQAAVALVDAWPAWPAPMVLLAGPVGSGKTHIVEMWRTVTGGVIVPAARLQQAMVGELAEAQAVAVEDLHTWPFDETALFHLLNRAREQKVAVLLTSRVWASGLPLRIPDLASRLRAAPKVELSEPDDALLRRVLVKLFADRQVEVDPQVIEYLATRMERSLAEANTLVDLLDREALAAGTAVTRRLAARALDGTLDKQPDLFAV